MAMNITVTVHDYTKQTIEEMKRKCQTALQAVGEAAVGHSQAKTPVDTGRLRNSITYATTEEAGTLVKYSDDKGDVFQYTVGIGVEDGELYVGTNVEYAEGIETGTHRRKGAAHMLKDSLAYHHSEYKTIIENVLKT